MKTRQLDVSIKRELLRFQRDEISSYHTYMKLSQITNDPRNQSVLKKIAQQELSHYKTWRHYTQQEVSPNHIKIQFYYWVSRLFGLTFGVKLMEISEEQAQESYQRYLERIPEIKQVLHDEEIHENELMNMLEEEGLQYAGSVVLGLNDALVELTGALAGFTFAFQNTRLIALAGLITGISASLSMAASEYLSKKAEAVGQNPLKSAIYTGVAYIFTVAALILPFLIFKNYLLCLIITLAVAVLIIAIFNYYISVAQDLNFHHRFLEMSAISLGVALLSFFIGYLVRTTLGIEV
jgi:VIT1/CCC1 family predicted Fe2+/Mn2+ transporter